MAFKGSTYRLAFVEGGLNGNDNADLVPKTAFIFPSRNVSLHTGGREKRGGTAKLNNSALTNAPKCLGIGQYIPKSGSNVFLSGHSDGKLWKNQTSAIKTGMSTSNRYFFNTVGDKCFICDGASVPQVYTTAGTIADIATPAADWTGSAQPAFMVTHGRGASIRNFAFGVPGFQDSFYASGSGAANFEVFVTGVLKFTVQTGDGFGIVGAMEHKSGDLFLFGKRNTFIFQDTDASTANWGWIKAPWTGGVAHQKLLVNADNEIFAMMEDGDIYNISTVAQVNDYQRASVTRPSYIHKYIANYIDLSKISEFHAAFEPKERCIYWWMVKVGSSTATVALKYYLDRPVADAWAVDDGSDNPTASGINATASCTVRNTDGSYSINTGDAGGFLWKIAQASKSDDSNGFNQVVRTPWLNLDLPRNEKRFVSVEVIFVVTGSYPLTLTWYVDGADQPNASTTVSGSGSVFPLTFGTSIFAAPGLNQVQVPLGAVGRRIMLEISNSGAGQNLFLSQVNIDFVDRGARPV